MRGAIVGGEIDGDPALLQDARQRLRRKKMTAGAAGRQQHKRRGGWHQISLPAGANSGESIAARGCSRVKASSMPMA